MTLEEACKILGISESTMRRRIQERKVNSPDLMVKAIDLKNLKISSSHLFYNRQSPEKTTKSIEICQNQASSEIPYSEKWVDTDLEINNNKNLNGLHRFFYLYIKIEEKQFLADTFFKKFNEIHYVSADRIGPKDFYLKENLGKFINVGAKGEMIANVIAHKKDELVNDILYLGEDAKTLEQQIQEWLKVIFGEAKFKVEDKGDIIYLYFNTKNDANWYKPSNVGFGFSYILPIIVSGLIAKEGEILIVENPEAHLHPRAQSKLTQFLSKVASTGVQVFIESHSEHILNGLRIASINQDIDINNEDISILYFHEKEEGYFTEIPILVNGDIAQWPDGFFDQTNQDLTKI
jgi:predicted ATPase